MKAALASGSWVAVLPLFALVSVAHPQAYPVKPIRMVTPTAAGGGSDILARLIGAKLVEKWRQQVVVDNRPGAGSTIGTDLVAKAPADGYTLLLIAIGHAINATLYAKLPYDTLKDFTGVIMLSSTPSVLVVNPELPVRSVGELITYAKARPGRLNYGSSGIGMSAHLAMELFKTMAGVDILHVPYKGIAQAQTALLGGQEVQLVFASPAAAMQHVKSGRLRALGVTTAKRSSSMPELPAIAESVPGYEASFWYGIVAPAATPRNIVRQLNSAISEVLVAPGVKEGMYALGVDAIGGDADAADRYIRQEVIKWQKVIKATGARLE